MTKLLLMLALAAAPAIMAAPSTAAVAIASLTDPAKLTTLKGERAVDPRFQKCIWYLFQRTINQDPAVVIDKAMELKGGWA